MNPDTLRAAARLGKNARRVEVIDAHADEWAEDREQLDVAGKTIAAFAERERTLRQRLEAAENRISEMEDMAQDDYYKEKP